MRKLPRILLLVDEFQEFFTQSDNISRQASLILDRLVRQGRYAGVHVMLGSQNLGGGRESSRAAGLSSAMIWRASDSLH